LIDVRVHLESFFVRLESMTRMYLDWCMPITDTDIFMITVIFDTHVLIEWI